MTNTQTYRTIILYESEEHRAIAEVYPNGSGYVKWQGKTNGEWINRLTEAKDATGMKKTIDKAETCPQL